MDAPLQWLLEVEARARALVDDASRDRQRIIEDALAAVREAENALWRLLAASRKMQKRVNALKYNIIPRYRATVQHIRPRWRRTSATHCSRSRCCAHAGRTELYDSKAWG